MAPHSSALAWKSPWMKEPGRLQSMGSLRVGHDWATSLSRIGEGNGNPLQCSCLENPRDGGAWWAAVCGVAQSQTRLKRLSSSSSSWEKMEMQWGVTVNGYGFFGGRYKTDLLVQLREYAKIHCTVHFKIVNICYVNLSQKTRFKWFLNISKKTLDIPPCHVGPILL